jgi:hypothetical protein
MPKNKNKHSIGLSQCVVSCLLVLFWVHVFANCCVNSLAYINIFAPFFALLSQHFVFTNIILSLDMHLFVVFIDSKTLPCLYKYQLFPVFFYFNKIIICCFPLCAGIAFVQCSSEKDLKAALVKNKTFIGLLTALFFNSIVCMCVCVCVCVCVPACACVMICVSRILFENSGKLVMSVFCVWFRFCLLFGCL